MVVVGLVLVVGVVVVVVGVVGLVNSGKGVKGSKGRCEKSKVVADPEKLFWSNALTVEKSYQIIRITGRPDDESKMLFPWKASDWIFTCLPAIYMLDSRFLK